MEHPDPQDRDAGKGNHLPTDSQTGSPRSLWIRPPPIRQPAAHRSNGDSGNSGGSENGEEVENGGTC